MTDENTTNTKTPLLGNRAYDVYKFIAQIVLPAAGTLYFALGKLWDLPAVEQVIGTITAVDIFLGALLSYSTKTYFSSEQPFDGALVIDTTDPMKDTYSLEVTTPLADLSDKKTIMLRVQSND